MLRLDTSITPDPFKPQKWDAYGSAPGKHELVVNLAYYDDVNDRQSVHMFIRGEGKDIGEDMFLTFLASLGLQPTGRMTSEPLPVASGPGTRIEPGDASAFAKGVEVGRREALEPPDGGLMEPEHRRLARMFGPPLRALREKHGVGLGRLARALGCQTAALSAFELGERPGDPQPLGTDAMDLSARKRSHHDVTGEALLRPPVGEMVGSLTGQNTSWYTARKDGYVDANGADYFVEAGEVYRLKDGRFEYAHGASAIATIDPSETIHPADNVAIETARNILVDLLTGAMGLVIASAANRGKVPEEADVQVALHDALNKPDGREGLKLYAEGLAPAEPGPDPATLASWIANSIGFEMALWTTDTGSKFSPVIPEALADSIRRAIETAPFMCMQVQAGLVAEAARVLGLIDGKDQQHDGEALQQALAILKQITG